MRKPYKELSLPQLRSFQQVCRAGSYAEAARQLDVSTSTVWEQLRGLERHFEARLLETAAGRVRPTPEGEQLLDLLAPLLAGLESAKEALHQLRGRPPASLTLVSGMRMLLDEVGPAAVRFRADYPAVRLLCLYAEDHRIGPLVEHGDADLGLVLEPGPGGAPQPGLAYEPAYELDFLLLTPPRHPLLTKRRLRLADVVRYPLVLGVPGTTSRRRIDEVLHREGVLGRAVVAVETNTAALTFAYVRAGVGIGLTAGHRRGFLGRGLGIRPLGDLLGAARYVFVRPKGAPLTPAVGRLAELIRVAARDE